MGDSPYVVVVGGANVDIAGRPALPLVPRDSNPGTVRQSHGGVGRNIAHNLALLGVDVRLVTAFGTDAPAAGLMAGCREVGIDIEGSVVVEGGATSTYLYVTDERGEMRVAINDMAILEELTPQRLSSRLDLMRGAAVCLLDANLPEQTIRWIADEVNAPLFADPISTAKAPRFAGVLGRLHTMKPNQIEAQGLAGVDGRDGRGAERSAQALIEAGLGRAFVSLGEDGLLCAERGRLAYLPRLAGRVVNTTGAGDAMMAGIVWAYLQGLCLEDAGLAGLAASSVAVESDRAVSPQMSEELLRERMARA